MGRAACQRPPRAPTRRRRSAGEARKKTSSPWRSFPMSNAAGRLARGFVVDWIASPFGLVALAAGKHPFPSRTRPLRLHAVMILRPGAWESNAPPILLFSQPALRDAQGRLAFFCARPRAVLSGRPQAQVGCACLSRGGGCWYMPRWLERPSWLCGPWPQRNPSGRKG